MKKSTRIFLLSIALLVFIGVVLRILTPYLEKPSETPNFDNTTTKFSKVVFTGVAPALPSELLVHQATVTQLPLEQFLTTMLASGEFTRNRYVDTVFNSADATLQVDPESQTISYSQNAEIGDPEGEGGSLGVSQETAVAAATSFFTDLFNLPADQLELTEAQFYASHESTTQVDPDLARYVLLLFDYSLGGIPVVPTFVGNSVARATVDADYRVRTAKFQPIQIAATSSTPFPTLTLEQAVAQINNNNAFVANARGDGLAPVDLIQVRQAVLTEVRLEYFVPSAGEQELVPYFRFSGTATNAAGQEFLIDILTPAVGAPSE